MGVVNRKTVRLLIIGLCSLTLGAITSTAGAVERAPAYSVRLSPSDFSACRQRLQQQAIEAGVAPATVQKAFSYIEYQPKVLELDRRQPEYTESFARYLNKRVTRYRVETGRKLYRQKADLLDRLTRQYGVPGHYILAFWGLETNYGRFMGNTPVLGALSTLACDTRRTDFFTQELLQALRLIDQYHLEPSSMRGSWAGAMGHTQFMPSAYRQYARDGDGDQRADLWNSESDALTSAANFLQALGWQRELRWGREVVLPNGFPYELTGKQHQRSLAQWASYGITTASGASLPKLEHLQGYLLVPAGHEGPAFMVYQNFDVIMRWNRSENYAIAVGYLADRIAGAGKLKRQPPDDQSRLLVDRVKALQAKLNLLGFDAGAEDGLWGPATRQAVKSFQLAEGLIADGYPGTIVFDRLGL